jgi:hypothetical protein
LPVAACVIPSSPIFVTLMKEAPGSSECRFLQEPHGVTTQQTPFFIKGSLPCDANRYRVIRYCENTTESGAYYLDNITQGMGMMGLYVLH